MSLLVPGLLGGVTAPGAQAAVDYDCNSIDGSTEEVYEAEAESTPMTQMGIQAAHDVLSRDGDLPGSGVKVAVIDSGVHAQSPELLDVVPGKPFTTVSDLLDYHGTAVAGLIAGKPRGDLLTGVAPGAQIVDVRVYDDSSQPELPAVSVDVNRVAAGLDWVADNAGKLGIQVATIAIRVPRAPQLSRAVEAARRADVVVVAASGNRPDDETDSLFTDYGELRPGEDVADVIYPAGYDNVVAVNATAGGHPDELNGFEASSEVLQNSATDVAAPTYGGVSVAVNGSTCVLHDVATSWAAAEVSGVVALLRDRYPDDSAAQIVARLTQTASGSPEDENVLTGAGVVQPAGGADPPAHAGRPGRPGPTASAGQHHPTRDRTRAARRRPGRRARGRRLVGPPRRRRGGPGPASCARSLRAAAPEC